MPTWVYLIQTYMRELAHPPPCEQVAHRSRCREEAEAEEEGDDNGVDALIPSISVQARTYRVLVQVWVGSVATAAVKRRQTRNQRPRPQLVGGTGCDGDLDGITVNATAEASIVSLAEAPKDRF